MTGITVVGTAGIVRPATASEGCGGMTGGTVQAGLNMSIDHTLRRSAIMTGSTIVNDAGMIESCRHEATGRMADTAVLIGIDMIDFFGCGKTGFMTGRAVIHDAGMIESCRQKTRGHVTVATVSVGRHMEIGFAGGGNPIMAGRAVIHAKLHRFGGPLLFPHLVYLCPAGHLELGALQ